MVVMAASKVTEQGSPEHDRHVNSDDADLPIGEEGSVRVGLGDVLDNLGSSVLRVVSAPRGLEARVGEPMIYDPLEGSAIERDAIVLAVGTRPDEPEARELISHSAAAGATAVAFKMHGRDLQWIRDADEAGLALLAVRDEVSWSHLNSLLSLTIPGLRRSSSIPGMASVPLGDLFALANAIAGVVGGAVTIEDPRARVLAYSNLEGQEIDEPRQQSILGRQVPDTPGVRALYRRLWKSDSLISVDTVEDFEIFPRIAVPVRVGPETLGSVWAVEGKTPLGREAKRALAEAARVVALHMLHARSSRDIERRTRGELLRSLLEGRGNVDSTATRLGVQPDSPMAVLALELHDNNVAEYELFRERLVDLVAMYSEAFRLRAACVAIGRTVYALIPVSRQMDPGRMRQIAREIHEHAESALEVALRTAVSSTVTDLRDVPGACREAERVLRVTSLKSDADAVATIEDVRPLVTLLVLKELAAQHPDLVGGPVEKIAAHDEEKGTSYLDTLRSYLTSFGDVPSAAAAINVHPNTFRYRLRRLTELFDIRLDDPDERLVLDLELRLLG
jgi:sugar diacid utilization regulator